MLLEWFGIVLIFALVIWWCLRLAKPNGCSGCCSGCSGSCPLNMTQRGEDYDENN